MQVRGQLHAPAALGPFFGPLCVFQQVQSAWVLCWCRNIMITVLTSESHLYSGGLHSSRTAGRLISLLATRWEISPYLYASHTWTCAEDHCFERSDYTDVIMRPFKTRNQYSEFTISWGNQWSVWRNKKESISQPVIFLLLQWLT
jgi:hypothetical protein